MKMLLFSRFYPGSKPPYHIPGTPDNNVKNKCLNFRDLVRVDNWAVTPPSSVSLVFRVGRL